MVYPKIMCNHMYFSALLQLCKLHSIYLLQSWLIWPRFIPRFIVNEWVKWQILGRIGGLCFLTGMFRFFSSCHFRNGLIWPVASCSGYYKLISRGKRLLKHESSSSVQSVLRFRMHGALSPYLYIDTEMQESALSKIVVKN